MGYACARRLRWVIPVLAVTCLMSCARTPQQKYAAFLSKGKAQLQKRDYPRAVLQFRAALQQDPKAPEAYYQLAIAYLGTGDSASAVASLWKCLQVDPQYAPAELQLAALAVNTNDPAELQQAEGRLSRLITGTPNPDPAALNILAAAEWKLGKREEAEQFLDQAVARFPQDLKSAINLAKVKLAHNDVAGAEATLKNVGVALPRSADAPVALGEFYLMTGRTADAERQFRRALAIDRNHSLALVSLAGIQWRAGKTEEAEKLYRQVASLGDPLYQSVHALFLFQSGKRDAAIGELQKLARQNPGDRILRGQLLSAYLAENKVAPAEAILAAALNKNASDVDALLSRAQISLHAGRPADAERDLETALHFQGDSAAAHYFLSKVHAARGATLQQRQELDEALRLNAGLLGVRIELAELLVSQKDPQAALALLDSTPENQKAASAIFRVRNWARLALGQKTEARAGIDQALGVSRTADVLMQDATLRLEEGDYVGARKSLQEALGKSPDEVGALDLLLQSYALQKQAAAGLQAVREFAAARPQSAAVQQYFGQLLLKSGDAVGARRAFESAKAADPGLVTPDLYLAELDSSGGKLNEARTRLNRVLGAEPGNTRAQLLLAAVEERAGNFSAALDWYRKLAALQDRNVLVLNNLAYLLSEYGKQPAEALKYAQQAQALSPDSPVVQDTLGWILYRQGLYTSAIPYLEKAVSREPTAVRELHLGLSYFKSGDRERGRRTIYSALRRDPHLSGSTYFQALLAETLATQELPR